MRKTLFLFLVILPMLYSLQEGDTECENKANPKSKKDCNGLGVGDKYKCWYVKSSHKEDDGSKKQEEECEPISKADYDRIKDYIKEQEETWKAIELDIEKYDCNSTYLLISIMSLIVLLL